MLIAVSLSLILLLTSQNPSPESRFCFWALLQMIPAPDWLSAVSFLSWPLPCLMSQGSFFVCLCLKTPGYWSSHQTDALGNGDSLCCWHSVHSLEGAVQSNYLPQQKQLPRLTEMSTLKALFCYLGKPGFSRFPPSLTARCLLGTTQFVLKDMFGIYVWQLSLFRAGHLPVFHSVTYFVCAYLLGFFFISHMSGILQGLVPASGATRVQSSCRAGWGPRSVGCQVPPHSCCHHTWATFGVLVLPSKLKEMV